MGVLYTVFKEIHQVKSTPNKMLEIVEYVV